MQYYPEVPHWWFGMIGLVSLIMSIISIEIFPTGLPIWGLLLAISLSTLWALPTGMIQAITNQQIPLADIAQLIAGYILPNRPVANMIFKASGYMVAQQAIVFSGDLKLGHYMKIPPRIMFLAQVMATFISCFIVTLVQNWMFSNIQDFCTTGQKDGFSCPSTRTFATNSLIWGGIGPARLFSPGQL
jgi:OPT family oligopeptide transporter